MPLDYLRSSMLYRVYYMAYYKTESTGKEVFDHMQQRDGLLELVSQAAMLISSAVY
jgi:hypothetical protein